MDIRLSLTDPIYCSECLSVYEIGRQVNTARTVVLRHSSKLFPTSIWNTMSWKRLVVCSGHDIRLELDVDNYDKNMITLPHQHEGRFPVIQFAHPKCKECKWYFRNHEILPDRIRVKFTHSSHNGLSNICNPGYIILPIATFTIFL